eukprot:1157899-Pelagomonas_calceolata.AAC.2
MRVRCEGQTQSTMQLDCLGTSFMGGSKRQPTIVREFVVDLGKRLAALRGVWNADALAEHGHNLDLDKYMPRNKARFRLNAQTLRVETPLWQERSSECDRCDQRGLQEKERASKFNELSIPWPGLVAGLSVSA